MATLNLDALARAVEMQESGGRDDAVSPKGALGAMQIMPATARDPGFGVRPLENPDDPEENRRFGREYLQAMLRRYDGDQAKALAAYNAGPGAVDKAVKQYGDKWLDHMPEETRNYIPSVMGRMEGGSVNNADLSAEKRRALATANARRRQAEHMARMRAVQTPEGLSTAQQLLGGFYSEAAKVIGAPVELVDQVFRLAGSQLLDKPGDAVKAVNDAFASVGIATNPGDGLAGKIGKGAFHALTSLAGMVAMAPAAVRIGATAGSIGMPGGQIGGLGHATGLQRGAAELGNTLLQRPGAALASEAGAVLGSEVAMHTAENENLPDWQRVALGVGGGLLGGTLGARATGLNALSNRAAARDELKQTLPPRHGESVRPQADPANMRLTAAIKSIKWGKELDDKILDIQRRYQELNPGESSTVLANELENALRTARAQERALWSDVPTDLEIETGRLSALATEIHRETQFSPTTRPNADIMRNLLGRSREQPRTVGDWLQVRSEALTLARKASAENNAALSRNYTRIANEISDTIADQVPTDEVRAAASFSRKLNDIFTRGPIGKVMATDRLGGDRVPDVDVARRLFSHPEGGQMVEAAADMTKRDSLREAAREALRAEFGESVGAGKPEAFLSRRVTRQNLEAFPGLEDELIDASQTFRQVVMDKKSAGFKALQEAAQQDPQVTIQRIIASANPAEQVKTLVDHIGDNPAALDGLRSGLVEEMLRRTDLNGRKLKAALENPKYDRMLREALTPQQVQRFKRMANAADKLETGTGRIRGRAGRAFTSLLARIFGAQAGRELATRIRGGTVQTPHYLAKATHGITNFMLDGMPVDELLARGVIDPKIERLLLRQVKPDLKEFRAQIRDMQQTLATMTASTPILPDADNAGQQNPR